MWCACNYKCIGQHIAHGLKHPLLFFYEDINLGTVDVSSNPTLLYIYVIIMCIHCVIRICILHATCIPTVHVHKYAYNIAMIIESVQL